MRRAMMTGLLLILAMPLFAAHRVPVTELERALSTEFDAHHTDAEIARRLADLDLTERLTDGALARLAKDHALGPRTAIALQLLADQSAFLVPPAADLPATAEPSAQDQQHMMDQARGYVVSIWPHLPDFFVTRTTAHFDDGPQVLHAGDWPVRAGMHLSGSATSNLTFRDGKETLDAATSGAGPAIEPGSRATEKLVAIADQKLDRGMQSWGDFGPELTIILTDTAKGNVSWSHWEETSAGLAAVYKFQVPRTASHFQVSYCCLREDAPKQRREMRYGANARDPVTTTVGNADRKLFETTPGYHGMLAIDPASGAVLRVTLETELASDAPLTRAATVVQYGPVMIGERRFVLPVRSLAISMEQSPIAGNGHAEPPVLLINETAFSHYHRLAATIRMLSDAEAASAASGAAPLPTAETATPAQPSAAAEPSAVASNTAPASDHESTSTADAAVPAQPSAPASDATTNSEFTVSAASGLPDVPANPAQPQASGFQLKIASRLVDVGLVAWDKKGHPVKDLKVEDIELYDNGKRQDVRSFTPFVSEASAAPKTDAATRSFSNHGSENATSTAPGATILLLDEAHIAWPDMANARQQILKFSSTLSPAEPVGIYTMTSLGFRVLQEVSTDHAAITAKLNKWMPTAQSAALAQEEETRNRQSFNEVHSTADLNSVNGNQVDVPDFSQTVDPLLRTMGSNPGRASLIILRQVARHLSAISGHKNLVWVSSDNVFADWQSNQVGIDKSPKETESFAVHAQEAMNDAHVAVYPMDVSQLETSAISADIRTRNVELNQASSDTASLNGGSVANSLAPGRNTAEMQQDMHPIQGPIRMVAESTGGRVIRRAGDLSGALNGIVEDGHASYQISFSPQGPADDAYHKIQIKLSGQRKGLTLRYRTGYLYSKEPESLKDRFQQALWRPVDVNEIAVSADCLPDIPDTKIKLTIAANDLGPEQRDGLWMDKLDIFFVQRDDAGLHTEVGGQTLGLRLKPETYQKVLASGIPFEHSLELKKGAGSLRVLVVDENSGRMGSVTLPASAFATP